MGQKDWTTPDDAYIDALVDSVNYSADDLRLFLKKRNKTVTFVEEELGGALRIWAHISPLR